MTFLALLTAIRRRALLVLAGLVVGLVVAAGVTAFLPRSYAATASLYVSAVDDTSAQNAYQGVLLSQQRVKSYTEILTSDRVLRPVMDGAGIPGSVADFADHVAVTTDTDSTVMKVTVSEDSPTRAADLANAIAARFAQVVGQLERPAVAGAPRTPAVTVATVDAAVADPTAVSPRWTVNLVVGAVVGLLLGIAAAVLAAATDRSLRRPTELAGLAGAPSLGSLPTVRGTFDPDAEGDWAEAVRRVRTNLAFADSEDGVGAARVLTVTSAVAGEGRTSLVQALATAFAATGRVAVVEGDLRAPVLGRRLGLRGALGLTDVLRGRCALESALQQHAGVDVLVSGEVPTDPSGLLASRALGTVLDRLRASHDVVLVDAPPLGPVADAAVLAAGSDGAVLLCRAGTTSAEAVAAATEALRAVGARVVGTVLTGDGEARAGSAPAGRTGADGPTSRFDVPRAQRPTAVGAEPRPVTTVASLDLWSARRAGGGAHRAAR